MRNVVRNMIFGLSLAISGCGTDGGGDDDGQEDSGCDVAADCGDGLVCLAYGSGPGTCVPTCEASASDCSAEATCGGSGLVVDVCEPNDARTPEGEVPAEEERPRLPCATDAECDAITGGSICVEWKGVKDCTIPCASEQACDLPSVGGITMDFLTCTPDEADTSRSGCVPDEACFANPMACVAFPGF